MASFIDSYKPKNLSEVVYSSDELKCEVLNYVNSSPSRPIILYGEWGWGKSTIASLLPESIDCNVHDSAILQMNATCLRDFSAQLNQIEKHALSPFFNNGAYIIIDEFDNYSQEFQRTLKGVMDKCKGRTLFVFTSNHYSKIDKGILSRCKKIAINPVEPQRWIKHFIDICIAENITPPEESDIIDMLCDSESGRDVIQVIEDYCIAVKASVSQKL